MKTQEALTAKISEASTATLAPSPPRPVSDVRGQTNATKARPILSK